MAILPRLLVSLLATTVLGATAPTRTDEPPVVVVSIKPLHSLVAAVMEGVGTPILLLDGAQSPHTYALKPSNAAALERAARVFWMGPSLEGFLARPLEALDSHPGVELGARLGAAILPSRLDLEPEHEDGDEHDGHEQEEEDEHGHRHVGPDGKPLPDLHVWLDPVLAAEMVKVIADELSAADPDDAASYRQNASALVARLAVFDEEIAAQLAPVRDRPFVVFHDAYQYLGRRYGLHWAGSLSVDPEHPPGARHLNELRARIENGRVVCVFAEPQFEPRLVNRLVEGTKARTATLDPDGGTGLQPGPEAYFTLMRRLVSSLAGCLGG